MLIGIGIGVVIMILLILAFMAGLGWNEQNNNSTDIEE